MSKTLLKSFYLDFIPYNSTMPATRSLRLDVILVNQSEEDAMLAKEPKDYLMVKLEYLRSQFYYFNLEYKNDKKIEKLIDKLEKFDKLIYHRDMHIAVVQEYIKNICLECKRKKTQLIRKEFSIST